MERLSTFVIDSDNNSREIIRNFARELDFVEITDCYNDIEDAFAALTKEHYEHLGVRIAQKALAYEVVELIHGKAKAEECKKMSEVLFSGEIKSLSKENIEELFGGFKVEQPKGLLIEDLLIAIKAASSKREAREFINGNAVAINGEKVCDLTHVVDEKDALFGEYVVIKRGKKNYYLVKFN